MNGRSDVRAQVEHVALWVDQIGDSPVWLGSQRTKQTGSGEHETIYCELEVGWSAGEVEVYARVVN